MQRVVGNYYIRLTTEASKKGIPRVEMHTS